MQADSAQVRRSFAAATAEAARGIFHAKAASVLLLAAIVIALVLVSGGK
jgi:hypothetical protein